MGPGAHLQVQMMSLPDGLALHEPLRQRDDAEALGPRFVAGDPLPPSHTDLRDVLAQKAQRLALGPFICPGAGACEGPHANARRAVQMGRWGATTMLPPTVC